jgi:hypothetical protein
MVIQCAKYVKHGKILTNAYVSNVSEESTEPSVDLDEIEQVIRKIRKDSTPGPDGVKCSDIKRLDIQGKADHTRLKGYRIITMANVWIKISEKVVAGRFVRDLEERGCLTPEVGGARPRRSTTSNLDATTHIIQQAMQKHQHTAIGPFDLKDAYNKVDIGILATKMEKMGISDLLIRATLCSRRGSAA